MIPKEYNSKEPTVPASSSKELFVKYGKGMSVEFVDAEGNNQAYITNRRGYRETSAKGRLTKSGFYTAFALWGELGEFIRFFGGMELKEYDPESPKMPMITRGPGFKVVAVDSKGAHLANIIHEDGRPVECAGPCISRRGYRTDWAEWTPSGKFIRCKEGEL